MTTTPDTLPRADVLAAVRAAWYEATREKHGNPTIALTTVLRVLGMGEHVTVVDGRAVLVARIDDHDCEDCNDTGTVTDPAPDAPGASPPELCECGQAHAEAPPPRTLPVTPAERANAWMLRCWMAWPGSPERADIAAIRPMGDRLLAIGLVSGAGAVTPAGRELLARVEAEERTPATVLRATLSRLRDAINNPPDGDDNDWKSAMRAALREHEAALAGTAPVDAPPRKPDR